MFCGCWTTLENQNSFIPELKLKETTLENQVQYMHQLKSIGTTLVKLVQINAEEDHARKISSETIGDHARKSSSRPRSKNPQKGATLENLVQNRPCVRLCNSFCATLVLSATRIQWRPERGDWFRRPNWLPAEPEEQPRAKRPRARAV